MSTITQSSTLGLKRARAKKWKTTRLALGLLAPSFVFLALFTFYPMFYSLYMSFFKNNQATYTTGPVFIGLDNYIRLFLDDDIFLLAVKNTFIFAMIVGPVSYLMSLMVAWFINELGPRIRAIVTLIFYAPSIAGQVYLIWQTLVSSDSYGWANAWLMELGITTKEILFFEDADYVMPLCIAVAIWTSLGTSFLSFIAGLQGIDKAQYEAGAVDGIKNRWQELWYITLPNMKPQLMFGAVMSITSAFGFGGIVTALCGFPSVDYAAHTIVHHLEDYGNQRFEIGYSSTIAVVLFVVMVGANSIVKKVLSKVGT